MKEIRLTKGFVALVDDEDFERLSRHKWRAKKDKTTLYAATRSSINGKRIYSSMHRMVMQATPGVEVDHRDSNGLNNQRSNLRICTHAQNVCNASLRRDSKTGYKGVSPACDRFRSRIRFNKQEIYLGVFKTAIEAARVYDAKAKELFGEFAKLNFA